MKKFIEKYKSEIGKVIIVVVVIVLIQIVHKLME
jgi:hypothetical protein